MPNRILNRTVLIGGIIYGVVNAIILSPLLQALVLFALLTGEPSSIRVLVIAGVIVWLLFPLGTGWFVARESIRQRLKDGFPTSARFAALRAAAAIVLGQLPLVLLPLVDFSFRVNTKTSFSAESVSQELPVLTGLVGSFAYLLLTVGLGSLGGALYFGMRGRRAAETQIQSSPHTELHQPSPPAKRVTIGTPKMLDLLLGFGGLCLLDVLSADFYPHFS